MTGLQGTTILFGVTGSIAAFKAAGWVSSLVREEARVNVVMTAAAARFVPELTFAALSGNPVHCDMFSDDPDRVMSHITLAREADLVLIAPATAHTIARLAYGLADDLLATAVLAAGGKPVIVCPAMNSHMYNHLATQENIKRLREWGYVVAEPGVGVLACGDEGPGRLPGWDEVREIVLQNLTEPDLQGHHVLVTAGPTREPLDPARFLSNRSSGKMGFALARAARRRGAGVTLITGPVSLNDPPGITPVRVHTADEMYEAVMEKRQQASIIIKAAAVADFRPTQCAVHKVKKQQAAPVVELEANRDILAELGSSRREGELLVGFAAETDHLEQEGARKLREKNLDLVVVNSIATASTGFEADTNQVLLLDRSGVVRLPLLTKEETADRILDKVVSLLGRG